MVTKRTRLLSGLVAIMMLVSLFTAFVLPVSAAGTGLYNATGMPNITNYQDGTTLYQVNSRAGMDKLLQLVVGGNALKGVTIYQTADIDMSDKPFTGIGYGKKGRAFSGTFDGNGFTIDNLYIVRNSDGGASGAGLFGCTDGAVLKNVGISGGLVIGQQGTGALVGYAYDTQVINCWNAATVVGADANGTGGLVGVSVGDKALYANSYNLGLVYSVTPNASGIVGYIEEGAATVKNCYNAGEIVAGFNVAEVPSAVLGQDLAGTLATHTNNYYVIGRGKTSIDDAKAAGNETITSSDGATGLDAAALADGTLAAKLNAGDLSVGAVSGFTVSFTVPNNGAYPVISYSKGGELICRTAKDNTNVNGAKTWENASEMFATLVAGKNGGFTVSGSTKLNNLTIKNADDMFLLGVISYGTPFNQYGNNVIKLGADIDMDKKTLYADTIDTYVPLGVYDAFTGTFNGQNHVIYNWSYYAVVYDGNAAGGLIAQVSGATVKNLGMVDAYGVYEELWRTGDRYLYPALMVEREPHGDQGTSLTMDNCFATGDILTIGNENPNNNGAVFSTAWFGNDVNITNCWGDVSVMKQGDAKPRKAHAVGKLGNVNEEAIEEGRIKNIYYLYDMADPTVLGPHFDSGNYASPYNTPLAMNTADGSLAWFLGNESGMIQTWKVKNGQTVFATEDTATYRLGIVKVISEDYTDADYYYYNTGASVVVPTVEYYALDTDRLPSGIDPEGFAMPPFNMNLYYNPVAADFNAVQEVIDIYEQYDFEVFKNGDDLKAVYDAAIAAMELKTDDELTGDALTEAVLAVANVMTLKEQAGDPILKNEYPYYAPASKYELYASMGVTDWGIYEFDDWKKIVEKSKTDNFSGKTIHLCQDVEMGNKPITAAFASKDFSGVLDGHGHVFKNLLVEHNVAVDGYYLGLIGKANSGNFTVQNVGIESGKIRAYGVATQEVMIAGFIGECYGGTFRNCWNNATVISEASGERSAVSGIARMTGNGKMINCYTTGSVINNGKAGRASGLNDWMRDTSKTYNCFSYATLSGKEGTASAITFRPGKEAAGDHLEGPFDVRNTYALGHPLALNDNERTGNYNQKGWQLDKSLYATGELAWMLNANYDASADGGAERTYFTVENEKTVFGTAENQTRRVTVGFTGLEPVYYYGEAGDVVTLNYADSVTSYSLVSGTDAVLEGNQLTIGSSDVEVTFELEGLFYEYLDAAIDAWEGLNPLYFTNANGDSGEILKTALEEAIEKRTNETFESQAEIGEYTVLLNSFVGNKAAYPNVPLASEAATYPKWPAYRIVTKADMEKLETVSLFSLDSVLYLENDLDMTGSTFAGTYKFKGSIEGNGHTISNMNFNGTGMFSYYEGRFIKNLTIKDSKVTITGSVDWNERNFRCGLFIGNYSGSKLDIDNVHIVDCIYDNSTTGSNSGGAIFLSRTNSAATINITNSGVDNCIYNQNNKGGNLGLFLGQMTGGAVLTLKNIYVTNNHIQNAAQTALFAGCVEGSADLYATNVLIAQNKISDDKNTTQNTTRLAYNIKNSKTTDKAESIKGTYVEWNRVIVTGTVLDMEIDPSITTQMLVNNQNGTDPANDAYRAEGLKYTDCYVETNKWLQNEIPTFSATGGQLGLTAEELPALAYKLNSTAGENDYKWEITPEGKIVWDADGVGQPNKVTFTATDYLEATEDITAYRYTNNAGTVIGLDDELMQSAIWPSEDEILAMVFTEDGTVEGTPLPAHECIWSNLVHVDGTETHTAECIWEGNGVACPKTATLACEYEDLIVTDANAEPENATHSGVCACGAVSNAIPCELTAFTIDSDCENPGSTTYVCDCGYFHTDVIDAKGHDWSAWVADEVEEGETQTHSSVCANCGATQTEDCTYTGEWVEDKAPTAAENGLNKKTCDKNCGSYITQEIPALAHFELEAETGILGREMNVKVNLKNSVGVAGTKLTVTYDPTAVTFVGAEKGDWTTNTYVLNGNVSEPDANGKVSVIVNFISAVNLVGDGTLVNLTFAVAEDAVVGEYDIAVSAEGKDAVDYNAVPVPVAAATGKLNIVEYVRGDISGDGAVSIADAVLMLRYACADDMTGVELDLEAADLTGDGDVLMDDVVLVLRYLNGDVPVL